MNKHCQMLPINKILCPTDFSEASYQSLKNVAQKSLVQASQISREFE
jgi:hypothetical protein